MVELTMFTIAVFVVKPCHLCVDQLCNRTCSTYYNYVRLVNMWLESIKLKLKKHERQDYIYVPVK